MQVFYCMWNSYKQHISTVFDKVCYTTTIVFYHHILCPDISRITITYRGITTIDNYTNKRVELLSSFHCSVLSAFHMLSCKCNCIKIVYVHKQL